MNPLLSVPFWIAAFGVPYCAITFADTSASPTSGLVAPLFGWSELVVLHLLAALPWTGAFAVLLRDKSIVVNPFVGGGVGVALAWVATGFLDSATAGGFYQGVLARTVFCCVLELPWCLAAVSFVGVPNRPPNVVLVSAAVAAVLLPGLSTTRLIAEQSARLNELLTRSRLGPAREIAVRIEGLDPVATVDLLRGPTPIDTIRSSLDSAIVELTVSLRYPIGTPAARIRRARAYLMLGRYPEAATTLKELPSPDPLARLLLGEVYQELGRSAESDVELRAGIDALIPSVGTHPAAASMSRMGYDALARNARDRHCPAEAEAIYHEALAKLPMSRAYLHFQFGRHYESAGRPAAALEHFREAENCDASYAPQVEPHIRVLQSASPVCVLR